MPHLTDTSINEEARLNALRDLQLLDTPPSESYDRLTRMASKLLGTPVSTISLTDTDRQWFKSKVGVDFSEIPRSQAPCHYAIQGDEVFVVPDLDKDPRFERGLLVQAGIKFYAGAPLFTRTGYGLGTLCVIDNVARDIDGDQRKVLRDLADMVMNQIELQNMIGRIDATTGLPNQHKMFEDLEEIASKSAGKACIGLLTDIVSAQFGGQGQRVTGTDYNEAAMRGAADRLRMHFNHPRIFQVAPTRLALLIDSDVGEAEAAAAAIREALIEPVTFNGVPINLSPTIGMLKFTAGEVPPRDVLRRLINALEDALLSEGGTAHYNADRDLKYAREFRLLNDFSTALKSEDQLYLAYQPRINMATGHCAGVEALIRWKHPKLGFVSPGDFIPVVEQTALVRGLTEWVIQNAVAHLAKWHGAGLKLEMSVNISAQNLGERDFSERVLDFIDAAGVDPHKLEFEFTESAMARDSERVIEQLRYLRSEGLNVAIDDFGTGYSNLSYLQQLPSSVLKIDRTFVSGITESERDRTLVRTIIKMAHDLGYRVVAEGIETVEVYEMLRAWGCDEGQGYLMSKPILVTNPMPITDFLQWMETAKVS